VRAIGLDRHPGHYVDRQDLIVVTRRPRMDGGHRGQGTRPVNPLRATVDVDRRHSGRDRA
jgi:hypothetical protein